MESENRTPMGRQLVFKPFVLDMSNEQLWHGDKVIRLHPKALAVLSCLLRRAGQLVSKDHLLNEVWPDTVVHEAVLTVAIRELRRALGDQARYPQFIETVYGRGYRFIAPIEGQQMSSGSVSSGLQSSRRLWLTPRQEPFVGREAELSQVLTWHHTALQGHRQFGLISGEPGIGKTALVDAFLSQIMKEQFNGWVGYGHCTNPHGTGEAYLPLLEAVGRLGRGPQGEAVVGILQRYAPSWLEHLPSLAMETRREQVASPVGPKMQARMQRELADALEMLSAERPLVLVLEDLHWSDPSTLEWLASIGRRQDPAYLLILGTFRPQELANFNYALHVMLRDLQLHRQCLNLELSYFSVSDVENYIDKRFESLCIPKNISLSLHQRTKGNPLFLISILDDLVYRGKISSGEEGYVRQDIVDTIDEILPKNLEQFIERDIELLSPDLQHLLEAGSVVGHRFEVASIAAATGQLDDWIEERCAGWVREGRFIEADGADSWLDGTVTSCYSFRHDLFRDVLYGRIPAARLVRFHQRIGLRKELGYGADAPQHAASLLAHFVRGRDVARAVAYAYQAGIQAMKRHAYQEAMAHYSHGLELLQRLPAHTWRMEQEVGFETALGQVLIATKGFSAPETEAAYTRALDLSRQLDNTTQNFQILHGLLQLHTVRAEHRAAYRIAEEILDLAQREHDALQLATAHYLIGTVSFRLGKFNLSRFHLNKGMSFYQPHLYGSPESHTGHDAGVGCLARCAESLWILGYPDQALTQMQSSLNLARIQSHPFTLAFALTNLAKVHLARREVQSVIQSIEAAISHSESQNFLQWHAIGAIIRGWALAMQGLGERGINQITQGLTAWQSTQAKLAEPYILALLSEAYEKYGNFEEGLTLLEQALRLIDESDERHFEAEVYRLKGEFLCNYTNPDVCQAELCFHKALAIAHSPAG